MANERSGSGMGRGGWRYRSLQVATLCALGPSSLAVDVPRLEAQRPQNERVAELPLSSDCDCRIELVKVISLSDSLHPGLFAYSPLVMRDSRGFWYVTSTDDGLRRVGVFDERGGLRKVIGRRGEGPGEFADISHIVVGPGDSLYVYDHDRRRRTVFDPAHEFVRAERIPGYMTDILPLSSGQMIINASIPTRDRVGWPLHIVGADGGLLHSFGAETPMRRPGSSSLERRSIAVDSSGTLWVALYSSYELAAYVKEGERFVPTGRRYRREVPWFRPWVEFSPGMEWSELKQIAFSREEPDLLWVLIGVPDANPPAREPRSVWRATQESADSLRDSILEAVNMEDGVVLASRRFLPSFGRLTFQGLIPVLRIDASQRVWMDVFEPTLAAQPISRSPPRHTRIPIPRPCAGSASSTAGR